MSAGIVVGILVVLLVIALALRPLWASQRSRLRPVAERAESERLENLLFERETVLAALRDLQLDYQMQKLSEQDFAELDERYRARAIEILRELDSFGIAAETLPEEAGLDGWIERAVAEVRQGKGRGTTLPHPADA